MVSFQTSIRQPVAGLGVNPPANPTLAPESTVGNCTPDQLANLNTNIIHLLPVRLFCV